MISCPPPCDLTADQLSLLHVNIVEALRDFDFKLVDLRKADESSPSVDTVCGTSDRLSRRTRASTWQQLSQKSDSYVGENNRSPAPQNSPPAHRAHCQDVEASLNVRSGNSNQLNTMIPQHMDNNIDGANQPHV
jgi:hypothetical protein